MASAPPPYRLLHQLGRPMSDCGIWKADIDQGAATVKVLTNPFAAQKLEWGNRQSEPIVLVHGFSSTADAWANVGEVLAAECHVIAPDLRGHGESAWDPQERYSDEQLAADIRKLAQQLGLLPFTLIGHSMGGAVAFTYAATYPEDISGL